MAASPDSWSGGRHPLAGLSGKLRGAQELERAYGWSEPAHRGNLQIRGGAEKAQQGKRATDPSELPPYSRHRASGTWGWVTGAFQEMYKLTQVRTKCFLLAHFVPASAPVYLP